MARRPSVELPAPPIAARRPSIDRTVESQSRNVPFAMPAVTPSAQVTPRHSVPSAPVPALAPAPPLKPEVKYVAPIKKSQVVKDADDEAGYSDEDFEVSHCRLE